EIIVSELSDVTFVPVQSVFVENDEHFVFLKTMTGFKRQKVNIGAYNNDFIELNEGVVDGDEVFLKMPDGYEPSQLQMAGENKRVIEKGTGRKTTARVEREKIAKEKTPKKA
ncbi:hypothetical protein N9Z18_02870, partial [Verrucomicrobiales bacterium]|nr:hypothetical protein [Verrucomicrobiales bacterium]